MEFLFFDTECANCFDGTGKICEFGYVLTDEQFNVIDKANILINPDAPFDKKGFAISKIKLAYPYATYYKSEKFDKRYDAIRALMTGDRVAIGHGVKSDVKFLLDECRRYGKASFNYAFLDSERLVATVYNRDKRLRLKDIYGDFFPDSEHTQLHEGADDAYMTMEIVKKVAADTGKSLKRLIEDVTEAVGDVFESRVVDRAAVFRYTDGEKMTAKNREIFTQYIAENTAKVKGGRRVTLPYEYEKTHFPQMLLIINRLAQKGYRYSMTTGGSGLYVSLDKNEARRSGFKATNVISWAQLMEMTELDEGQLLKENIDIFELIRQMDCNREWYERYLIYRKHCKKYS